MCGSSWFEREYLQYLLDTLQNLSPTSLSNAEAAIREAQAHEDRLNDDKHARQYRAETKVCSHAVMY